ncbi:Bor family protein [Moraxella sp. Tifton1]|uniref:Bor family protein n=1 Tax=Moraxella oculi TaxID=2940516 RepID=A0ABW8U7I8_9GAMM|nr:Bor family protein [Moraxella sp. Tifton1]MCL1623464.1 Bor family protein [Moraxella sp. Tifton1]
MKKLATVGLLSLATILSGCAAQTALIRDTNKTTPAYSQSQSFFIGGIAQEKTIDAAKVCGGADKVASVQSKDEPKDLLLSIVTLGIYSPKTSTVYCR